MGITDMTGQTFGRLTVVRQNGYATGRPGLVAWLCHCGCGKEVTVAGPSLRKGLTTSCGCAWREWSSSPRKHGHACKGKWTAEYVAWTAMIRRCEHPHKNDGGAYIGVSVCKRWRGSFEAFLADVGPKPSKRHSLDRFPNHKGNYEPGNVRWATTKEQSLNRRVTIKDGGVPIRTLAERAGLNYRTVIDRYRRGDRGERLLRAVPR